MKERLELGLDETRTLVLGAQVLVGFQYRSVFEALFPRLSGPARYLDLAALGMLVVCLAFLSAPATYHPLVDGGRDVEDFPRFVDRMAAVALPFFALGLGMDLYIATEAAAGPLPALAAGLAGGAAALGLWIGLPVARRRRGAEATMEPRSGPEKQPKQDDGKELADKIKHALAEVRVVLPGVQALLGFQFSVVLMDSFRELPAAAQHIHLASLGLMTLCTILLMTPAAYHRLAEDGRMSERFHRLAGRLLLLAMLPLALGIGGDLYVLADRVTGSAALAGALAAVTVLFYLSLWFGYPLYRRRGIRHFIVDAAGVPLPAQGPH